MNRKIRAGLLSLLWARLAVGLTGSIASVAIGEQTERVTANGLTCPRAATRVERAICNDPKLVQQDTYMAAAYAGLVRHAPTATRTAILRDQRAWLVRRDACRDTACVSKAYDDRSTALWQQRESVDRWRRRNVARVGQCETTTIDQIGPRLGDGTRPDDSGTSITFANGVHQVSYDLERAIARSRLGDRARVCLVALPRHCPPGDDRGRSYAVTNLRTGAHWRLFDSQHLCGGA
ncbi:hypothetical protein [Sphingomonas sp. CARO-RG-8B-R24-01]|uniref:lysozyme inhibitor LprI family protein n=1 Tax=Sphingomonas sp. CARO-RG-8B-R24-01 TaxID=2914831 RepID=UPI001F56D58A|nr:hypothetical protein [Sphingomonas sp. CARO-RG-8B-R24-01]